MIEIANGTASADAPNSLTFHGALTATGTAATAVWVAWDTNSARTEADPLSVWAEKHPFGTMTTMTSNLSHTATGLASDTLYYYRFFASNTVEGLVGAAGISNVTTLASDRAPTISNLAATPVSFFSATLKGYLDSTGSAPTTVWAAWDTNAHPDVETEVPSDWMAYAKLTPDPMTSEGIELSHPVASLSHNTKYYCSFFASNSVGTVWALSVTNFTTRFAGPVIANAAATREDKSGAQINASLSSTGAAATTVWAVWDTTDHPAAALPADWPASTNLGPRGSGAVSNVLTGLAEDTPYSYRFYASNQYAQVWAQPSLTFRTLPNFIVDWDGDYVAADAAMNGTVTAFSDGGRQGQYIAFSDTTSALNPASGYDTTRRSARFYGGVMMDRTTLGLGAGNFVARVMNAAASDGIRMVCTKSDDTRVFGAVVWLRADFRNVEPAHARIDFRPDSVMRAEVAARGGNAQIRFLVRDGKDYYVSQTNRAAAGTFTLSNPGAANWAPYSPSGRNIIADLSGFAPHEFLDIRAVGYYVHTTATGGDPEIRVSNFEVKAHAGQPFGTVFLLR